MLRKLARKRLLILTLATALTFPWAAHAVDSNNDVDVEFREVLTLGNEVDMDFDSIFIVGIPAGGDTASMGTNGSIAYAGNFTGSGTGTAGRVDVTAGTNGQTIDVYCDATAVMTDGAGASINVVGIETVAEGSEGAYGTGNACAGMGTVAVSAVLNISTLDTFAFGGQVDGSTASSFASGNFSTANAGGNDIQVDIVYQ